MEITNIAKGPRGVNTTEGLVMIEPNDTIEADVYEREKKALVASEWFKINGSFTPNPTGGVVPAVSDSKAVAAVKADGDKALAEAKEEADRVIADKDAEIEDLRKQLAASKQK